MLRRLAPADYATLTGLGLGWTAISLYRAGAPDEATLTLLLAFLCDKVDGYLARRGHGSELGQQLDALADVVIYLVSSAIIVADLFGDGSVIGNLTGAIVIGFGVLRLARYAIDEPISRDGTRFYRGFTAFHVAAWALIVRVLVAKTAVPPRGGAVAVVLVAPLMIAPFRTAVTRRQFAGAVVVGSAITVGVLA